MQAPPDKVLALEAPRGIVSEHECYKDAWNDDVTKAQHRKWHLHRLTICENPCR